MKKAFLLSLFAGISIFAVSSILPSAAAVSGTSLSDIPADRQNAKAAGADDLLDSFSDGEFASNPIWSGNTSSFAVVPNSDASTGATGSQTLRLNAPATNGTEYLSTPIANWGTSQEWRFWIGRRNQAFTSENQQYVWLYANSSDLNSASVQGYRIQIGDNSGGDEIRLQYVNGAVPSTVITSSGSIANGLTDIGLLVRVKRFNGGTWQIFTSALPPAGNGAIASEIPTEANTPVFQGTGVNSALVPATNGYFGVAALHANAGDAINSSEWDQLYFLPKNDVALPFTNNQPILAAIGQPNLNDTSSGVGSTRMNSPWDVAIDQTSGKVYVADSFNNRVLRFADTQTLLSGGIAETVFGQTGFTASSSGSNLNQMSEPRGVSVGPDGTLWVSDTLNNRILYFNNAATALNGVTASGFVSLSFNQPWGLDIDSGGRLWVADMLNNRVLRFDSPKSSPTNFSARACAPGSVSATTCSIPSYIHIDSNDNLWVADSERNRVLRFHNASTMATGTAANGVLGQFTFTSSTPAVTQNQFNSVNGITTDPMGNLYVADGGSHRILIFATAKDLPNGANAFGILGKPSFTSTATPPPGLGAAPPAGLAFDSVRWDLLASDPGRNRVIRYNGVDPDPDLPPSNLATDEAIDITSTTATLQGFASPNMSGTFGYFRYGTTVPSVCDDSYGTRAPSSGGVSLGSGTAQEAFYLGISGLIPATTYYFCAAAENAGGRAFGGVFSFTTGGAPDSVTESPLDVRTTNATLRGYVTPNGDDAIGYFRISDTNGVCNNSFGTRAPESGGFPVASGSGQTLYSQNLEGLSPNTTYYYCSVAENAAGTSFGSVFTFITRSKTVYHIDNYTNDASGSLNACTPSPNDCSLRGGVSMAGNGDTLKFIPLPPQETLTDKLAPAETLYLFTEIEITRNITIEGVSVAATVISGLGEALDSRMFTIAPGANVRMTDLRMSNGRGGGTALGGGAIHINGGQLSLDKVEVSENGLITSAGGGAIYIVNAGVLNISNSSLYNNSTFGDGGAIMAEGSTVNVSNSTISGNTGSSRGGGIAASGSNVNIRNSTITANSSAAFARGGGIDAEGSSVTIGSSIVSGNIAQTTDDIRTNAGELITSLGNNMIGDEAGDAGSTEQPIAWQLNDILDVPNTLGALQNNGGPTLTHSPSGAFPGKDKGCAFGLATDQRGLPRVANWDIIADAGCTNSADAGADIGAVELLAPTAASVSISGRALSLNGMGIKNAVITVHGDGGPARRVVTNTFGYYRVEGLSAGSTYVVTIAAAKYSFPVSTRIFAMDDNILNADFTANR